MNGSELSIRSLVKVLRKLKISDGDVVTVLESSPLAKEGNIDRMAQAIGSLGMQNVLVLVVSDFSDIKVLNETEMRKHGWFKVAALRNVLHLKPEGDHGKEKD